MITDARVLQPEFIPTEVKHRDAELNTLSAALNPITHGDNPDTAFLFGPSGVGKTCLAKFLVEQLRETVVDLNYQYVNCWEDYSRFKTLYRILDGINHTFDVHRQSTPKDVLLERLREYDGSPYIVILDEVDQLEDKQLLYELYRIRGLTMILIANSEQDLFASLDNRLNSRFQVCTRARFNPYGNDALVAILRDRVRWGLKSDVVCPDELRLIADMAAGDARAAIGILRKAVQTANQSGYNEVSSEVIRGVVPEAKAEIEQRSLDKLTDHQRVLYDTILDYGEIAPSTLFEIYSEVVENPKTQRMVRNYLTKLEHYNLIISKGSTKGRTYHPYSP
ncbi:orc1/cdc6 family replication initiation protein [Natronococcus sp. A-GB1]|uniref:Cdc6/Cdc18 family protein n=1 Tax=Natronococcus sp. A-GB1 TaxID=3037648 RepID=UPI00241BF11D|nr:Cdc6/Cdc18 family protein [Natronococcus sp. A-GB1]MDG5760926.1 orc1/cdc6 family replication initiation protein [Natronococcus sp. A-GB1]